MLSAGPSAMPHHPMAFSCPPTPRAPLRELPMSPGGALIGCRTPTHRPLPSADKENQQALREALESQQQYYLFQLQELARGIEQLQRQYRHTHRILRSSIRISQSQIPADDPPAMPQSRLSMPELSDDSGSEPDLSVLAMTRPGPPGLERLHLPPYDISHDHLQEDDTSLVEGDVDDMEGGDHTEDLEGAEGGEEDVEDEEGDEDEDEDEDYVPLADPATLGLKEISNLGKFTVSSHKQGNGVDELRSDDLGQYWQSDGPQPHKLTVYFVKRVGIRDLRFYVNYNEDESYTPTKIIFKSGTSENNLIEFAQMTLETPVGWQQVSLSGAGGDPDGNTLVSYVLQMQILENHQNGKDTHLRGIKIYAFDMDSGQAQGRENNPIADMVEFLDVGGPAAASVTPSSGQDDTSQRLSGLARRLADTRIESGEAGLSIPDFMRDPEIR